MFRYKHPTMRDPDITGPKQGAFDPCESTPDTVPLNITATDFEKITLKVQVPFAVASKLWISATGSCELAWSRRASYRALMACRLVALDKPPRRSPNWHRQNRPPLDSQVCLDIHWTPSEGGEPEDVHVTLMVDATNCFNELGRKAMLWTVRYRWVRVLGLHSTATGTLPCSICVAEVNPAISFSPMRGDPPSTFLYGIALLPLGEDIRQAKREVVQHLFADDRA